MKLTPTLWRRFWTPKPVAYPPLPTNPRESRQLLNLLQSSFKQRLDDVHPPVAHVDASKAAHAGPTELTNPSADAANDHLSSILHHPLLGQNIGRSGGLNSPAARALALLDAAIVDQKVTPDLIDKCISIYRSEAAIPQIQQPRRLSHGISSWFSAAGPADRERFLTSPTIDKVVSLMYGDGQEQTVWEWLRILYEGNFGGYNPDSAYDPTSPVWQLHEGNLIRLMIKETLRRKQLDVAIQEYGQAWNFMINSGRLPRRLNLSGSKAAQMALFKTFQMISGIIVGRGHNHGLGEDVFRNFLKMDNYWDDVPGLKMRLSLFARFYHPTKPSAANLYQALSEGTFEKQWVAWIRLQDPKKQKMLVVAILDGAQVFLDQGHPRETQLVLDEVEKHFPDHVSQGKKIKDKAYRIFVARQELDRFSDSATLAFSR